MKAWARRLAKTCLVLLALPLVLELVLRLLVPEAAHDIVGDRPPAIFAPEDGRKHPYSVGATNAWRIGVVGDSVTVGSGTHRYDRFASRLEWLMNLNEGNAPVEVDVFAKPSATYQQGKLVDAALARDPRLLVLIVHLNDTENWGGDGKMVALRKRMTERAPPHWLRLLMRVSCFAHVLYWRIEEAREGTVCDAYYRYLYRPDYSGLQKFRAAVVEYRDLCRARGTRLLAVVFPLLNRELRPGRYPYRDQHKLLREFFAGEGVDCLDLLDAYSGTSRLRDESIHRVDDHPSELAHRIAADAIFRHLLATGIVDSAYAPREIEDESLRRKWEKKLEAFAEAGPME